jgi:hypothetical protein
MLNVLASSGMTGVLALSAVGLLGLMFFGYVFTHRADGKPQAEWDCGRDDCRHRGRNMHRHPQADDDGES